MRDKEIDNLKKADTFIQQKHQNMDEYINKIKASLEKKNANNIYLKNQRIIDKFKKSPNNLKSIKEKF